MIFDEQGCSLEGRRMAGPATCLPPRISYQSLCPGGSVLLPENQCAARQRPRDISPEEVHS